LNNTLNTWLTKTFNIKYPIILAPMFLVSNIKMLISSMQAGFMGCIPTLNFKTDEELKAAMKKLKDAEGPFGVNLIVNKSNIHYPKHLKIIKDFSPDFIITSLGSPEKVINTMGNKNTKIFCDVIGVEHAQKVEKLGADALIAVNSGAGGHAGPLPSSVLVPLLKSHCKLPIISAGGVGNGEGLLSVIALGAEGASIGSPFIATEESPVGDDYKQACVDFGAEDIVMTTKISGTPCTVINTPYVRKIGTRQNLIESYLNKHKSLKKYVKMITYYKGSKLVEKAAFKATYKTVWCAGPSIEFVRGIEKVSEISTRIMNEYEVAYRECHSINASFNGKLKKAKTVEPANSNANLT
jgi:nitronate monooxygenase